MEARFSFLTRRTRPHKVSTGWRVEGAAALTVLFERCSISMQPQECCQSFSSLHNPTAGTRRPQTYYRKK